MKTLDLRYKLDHLVDHARATIPWCKSAFLVGEPAERIASLARDVRADLIITTSSHLRFLSRMFNLDNGARIVRPASCPVFVYQATDT
jgi:nucleotide-binding universal stress UspA family protein